MNYEEKRELRLQISQLLADAGLNQKNIKDIVEEEIRHKVDWAIEAVANELKDRVIQIVLKDVAVGEQGEFWRRLEQDCKS